MSNCKEKLNQFFFKNNTFTLKDYKLFEFIGVETRDYLQRQLSADMNNFKDSAGLACRLDRSGRVFTFFYLINIADKFFMAIDKRLAKSTVEELERFIIMEDITIKELNSFVNVSTKFCDNYVPITIFDGQAFIGIDELPCNSTVTDDEITELITLTAWPTYDLNVTNKDLVNETRLNKFAVSYNKGCFLGQETASKIESRRGAARFPILITSPVDIKNNVIEIDGKKISILSSYPSGLNEYIYSCKVPRDFLVNDLELDYDGVKLHLNTYPIADLSTVNLSEEFFNKAVKLFHAGRQQEALDLLEEVISFNPTYADAYETKGVILGNSGEHEKAIAVMDELLKIDENSVMAHTNKSLYLMKLGKIEEAEEEKALATVASFKRFGDEAKTKKALEEQKRIENEDRARRFEMFNKVLAIDKVDVVANYGLADIHFTSEKFEKALEHIDIVLNENPKYSVAYLLKSKILFQQKKYDECLLLVEKAIPIATSQGELMPANEMQSIKAKVLKR